MKKIIQYGTILLVAALFVLVSGCKPQTPDEVTAAFWQAMQQDRLDVAAMLTSNPDQKISSLKDSIGTATFSYGEPEVSGDAATVKTTLMDKGEDGSDKKVSFSTMLLKTDEGWRVDWPKTSLSLTGNALLGSLHLQKLGDMIEQRLTEKLNAIAAALPQLEQQLLQMGEASSRQIEENWQEYLPEIQKSIEELTANLDGATQAGNDNLEQHLQENIDKLKKAVPEIQAQMDQASKDASKNMAEQWREAIEELNDRLREVQAVLETENKKPSI